jgi:hypothetical protein
MLNEITKKLLIVANSYANLVEVATIIIDCIAYLYLYHIFTINFNKQYFRCR